MGQLSAMFTARPSKIGVFHTVGGTHLHICTATKGKCLVHMQIAVLQISYKSLKIIMYMKAIC